LLVAIIITLAVNPLFARLSGRSLTSIINIPTAYKEYFLGLLLSGTFLSGIYPALVLSRYQPVAVLKGIFKNAAGGQWLRKGLIVGQFAASIILIAGTMIVYRQMHYMQSQELGANINETLVIKGAFGGLTDSAYHDAYGAFKEDLLKLPGVKSITSSSAVMGEEILWSTNWLKIRGGSKQTVNLFHLGVDEDFIGSYGLKIIAGHSFSRASGGNQRKIILNESAVHALGIASAQSAIGELISGGQGNMDSMEVTGVISDYHNEGLQKSIQPLVLFPNRNTKANYSVKIEGQQVATAVASIKKVWDRHFTTDPFDYFFLDEFFNRQYDENRRFGTVFGLFAILAITIACFGLLGLSAYNVLERTKEIGVRKVLGASVNNLVFGLSKDFLILVVIAFVIAIPITAIAMHSWLQGFAYRTGLPWWIFAAAGLVSIVIALLTVGFQALKAALANPIKSLRSE
jgi:putative ABC transport system permease protein